MRLPAYRSNFAFIRFWCATAPLFALAFALAACGDDDSGQHTTRPHDAGSKEDAGDDMPPTFDANIPLPTKPRVDGSVEPGEKPPELAEEACAIDTNKLYDLATSSEAPRPTQLGVDLINSHFAFAFIGRSEKCRDAVFITELSGASGIGMPEKTLASDECTSVQHVSITHTGEHWLLAISDGRMGAYDVFVQSFADGSAGDAQRITDSIAEERETAITTTSCDPDQLKCDAFERHALVAWSEQDDFGNSKLAVRPIDLDGVPTGDAVVLEESTELQYTGLSLAQLGDHFIGLGYRRFGPTTGVSEIVLDVLDAASGVRDRDSWVLSAQAGPSGSVDISADGGGGGVMYSLGQAESQQLWFQQLDKNGRAAPVVSAGQMGGPSEPSRIVGPPINATDASLAKLPSGFAVAYRVLPGGMVPQARIRAHFLDHFGREIGKSDVALTSELGGRTAIESAYDGRITLGWSSTTEEGDTTLTAAKLPCVGGL